jgi:hypothetical protein
MLYIMKFPWGLDFVVDDGFGYRLFLFWIRGDEFYIYPFA